MIGIKLQSSVLLIFRGALELELRIFARWDGLSIHCCSTAAAVLRPAAIFSLAQPPPKPSALILELNVDPFEGSVWLKKFPLAMRFETLSAAWSSFWERESALSRNRERY
jgi:hypothetical protein